MVVDSPNGDDSLARPGSAVGARLPLTSGQVLFRSGAFLPPLWAVSIIPPPTRRYREYIDLTAGCGGLSSLHITYYNHLCNGVKCFLKYFPRWRILICLIPFCGATTQELIAQTNTAPLSGNGLVTPSPETDYS